MLYKQYNHDFSFFILICPLFNKYYLKYFFNWILFHFHHQLFNLLQQLRDCKTHKKYFLKKYHANLLQFLFIIIFIFVFFYYNFYYLKSQFIIKRVN